ncbi:cupin domain-containing protein [Accumulibacter sp.]|uniref:cupin domain-containing protein n=1 Tax=Accumulibacter sp. TaxID=2053492 RepID=UPI002BA4D2FF|nr:cupin domain-containing protein [Accumulibacter sp.]HPU79227.1 cupin domain-containing protein [Accumulibacter sp.]
MAATGARLLDNLFAHLPPPDVSEEQFSQLLARPGLRIERIVSHGHASPPGFWYDQPQGEWVLLVQGEASLRFDDEPHARRLRAGDYLFIAPHRRHRVDWTRPDEDTIWLAVHCGSLLPAD